MMHPTAPPHEPPAARSTRGNKSPKARLLRALERHGGSADLITLAYETKTSHREASNLLRQLGARPSRPSHGPRTYTLPTEATP